MAMGKKPDAMMLAVFGKKKPAASTGSGAMDDMDTADTASESDEGIPPDFEDEAIKAFPELEGAPDRLQALYNAMKACC